MTIWRLRILCWIPKDTNTRSEYEILFLFFLHGNNGSARAPQRHVYTSLCLVFTINTGLHTKHDNAVTSRVLSQGLKRLFHLKSETKHVTTCVRIVVPNTITYIHDPVTGPMWPRGWVQV